MDSSSRGLLCPPGRRNTPILVRPHPHYVSVIARVSQVHSDLSRQEPSSLVDQRPNHCVLSKCPQGHKQINEQQSTSRSQGLRGGWGGCWVGWGSEASGGTGIEEGVAQPW